MPEENMRYAPMLLTKVNMLPDGDEWGYQIKLDGYRMLPEVSPGRTVLFSRNNRDHTRWYPKVAEDLVPAFDGKSAVCDAELIALTPEGHEDFDQLRKKRLARAALMIFDLLELQGEPLLGIPLYRRWEILAEHVQPHGVVGIVPVHYDLAAVMAVVKSQDREGVVAKRLHSPYRPGIRSKDWLKLILKPHPDRHNAGWGRR